MSTSKLSNDGHRLNSILQRHGVVEVMIFGSFARGSDIRPESDIDLLVTYKPGITLFELADLQQELEEALGRKVDLISKKNLSTRLAKRINKEARPLSSLL